MAELRSPGSNGASANGERYARLHGELRRPAYAMVRRAFRAAFCEAEIEDIYSSAWLGTLRALERREDELTEEELRRYLLTAVANHASKELRRRGRRPTFPLEDARAVADSSRTTPDEQVLDREETREARDVLTSLPPRRRAVLLLRYGWGLEPSEVCAVVDGLSARAYRREITRGVEELGEKLKQVQGGEWCESREPVLRAYVAGEATEDQSLQAKSHLDHCHHCSDYVGRLAELLHDASGAVLWTGAAAAIGGPRSGLVDLASDALHRVGASGSGLKERVLGGGADGTVELSAAQIATSGGARGAGAAGAGVLAQIAGVGVAGKAVLACVGTGVAATACVAAGVVPGVELPGAVKDPPAKVRASEPVDAKTHVVVPIPVAEEPPIVEIRPEEHAEAEPDGAEPEEKEKPKVQPAPVGSPAPAAPPEEHEFGLAGAAVASGKSGSRGGGGSTSSGGGGGSTSMDAAAQEFGP